jgi:UPF0755 protein
LNKKLLIALCIAIFLITGVVAFRMEQIRRWKWEPIPMSERFARVPADWSPSTLAKRMEESKKIRDANTFVEAASQVGLKEIRSGGYLLPEKAGPLELAKVFAKGPSHARVTFPEGFTAWQISARLAESKFAAAAQLRALAYPKSNPLSPLEGELFPDTYWLPLKATAPELAAKMRERFKEVAKTLPKPFPVGYQNKRLTPQEVTTLASLVERETHLDSERPLVAGVLLGRLRDHMRLQCDATVQYALQRAAYERGVSTHQDVTRADYKFESPYNTYRNFGLPPAPICNPGKASLMAAARPKETKYVFYVWSPKLKRHRFSVTYQEHLHNIELAKKETITSEN